MPRSTRSRTKQQKESQFNSLSRKINAMSPTKKLKLKDLIHRFNQTRKEIKQEKQRKMKKIRSIKKKYGKYSRSYYDLEKKGTPAIANKILLMTKELEKYERKTARDLKKFQTEKNKLEKRLLKLDEIISSYENSIKNYSSPSWREKNVSPELLEHLQVVGVFYHIHSLREECNRLRQRKVKLQNELETVNKNIQLLTK